MVWSNMQTLPIEIGNGWADSVRDNSLVIYYKFDQQYWQGSSLPSLGYNGGGSFGPTVGFNGPLNWELV